MGRSSFRSSSSLMQLGWSWGLVSLIISNHPPNSEMAVYSMFYEILNILIDWDKKILVSLPWCSNLSLYPNLSNTQPLYPTMCTQHATQCSQIQPCRSSRNLIVNTLLVLLSWESFRRFVLVVAASDPSIFQSIFSTSNGYEPVRIRTRHAPSTIYGKRIIRAAYWLYHTSF